jgi:hypothetical protein
MVVSGWKVYIPALPCALCPVLPFAPSCLFFNKFRFLAITSLLAFFLSSFTQLLPSLLYSITPFTQLLPSFLPSFLPRLLSSFLQ